MKRLIFASDDFQYDDTIITLEIKDCIKYTYENLKMLPKPDESKFVSQYYGSTPLYSVQGNMLDLLWDEPYTVTYPSDWGGGRSHYRHAWAIRVGGAYKQDATKYLMEFIEAHKQEIFDAGYAIIDQYGTNFCVYGIARR